MKLTTRGRYALRMMLEVARHDGNDRPTSLAKIAELTGISRGYLEQLAIPLRNARLLRAASGRHGGYKLTGPASGTTLGDIIEAVIGPICVVDCVEAPEACSRSSECEARLVYSLINHRIAEVLRSYTLADLIDPSRVHSMKETVEGLEFLPDAAAKPSR